MMRKLLLATLALATSAASAFAVEYEAGALHAIGEYGFGAPQVTRAAVLTPDYSNVTNFLGQGFVNGGAALQGANTITRLVADDVTPNGADVGSDIVQVSFSVANFSAVPVTARARIRFWFPDGAGGGPGTYYNVPAAVGFTFSPFAFGPGVTLLTGTIGPGLFSMPGGTIWAGITFDDNNGTTGATLAQMNGLGQGFFDPPTVGSSADVAFQTQAAGSFFTIANPPGTLFNFSGQPVANFAWELVVDRPTPTHNVSWGRIKAMYR